MQYRFKKRSGVDSPQSTLFLLPIILAIQLPLSAQPAFFQEIWHITGEDSISNLGMDFVSVGDQNFDGYDDILISNFGSREVFLYYGGDPMDTIPDMIFSEPSVYNFGFFSSECKDLNGDGGVDFCISSDGQAPGAPSKVYVYFGGELLDNQADLVLQPDDFMASNEYGVCVSMGDVNGDGYNDLALVDRNYNLILSGGSGLLQIFYGGPEFDDIPDFVIYAEYHSEINVIDEYVSIAGDVNNDGFDDILFSGSHSSTMAEDCRLILFGGDPPDTEVDWYISETSTEITWMMGSYIIPDFNGDDNDDILMIGTNGAWVGYAFLFYGGELGEQNIDVILDGGPFNFRGGGPIGDINNDGNLDVMISSGGTGFCDVFYLDSMMGLYEDPDFTFILDDFNYIFECAGDINGDGVDDAMLSNLYYPINEQYPTYGEVLIYGDPGVLFPAQEPLHDQIRNSDIISLSPNPFNTSTTITFILDRAGRAKIAIYDITGRSVGAQNFVPAFYSAGKHEFVWNAEGLSSGVYLVRLTVDGGRSAAWRKVALVK